MATLPKEAANDTQEKTPITEFTRNVDLEPEVEGWLEKLEKELVDSFKEFREVYLAAVDPRKQLSNQEIYDKVQDEYKEYHEEVEKIKQKTIEIMKRIQRRHDYEDYQKILVNL